MQACQRIVSLRPSARFSRRLLADHRRTDHDENLHDIDRSVHVQALVGDTVSESYVLPKDTALPLERSHLRRQRARWTLRSTFQWTLNHLLPRRYPHSVAPEYGRFALLSCIASVSSSAAGVLGMQAMLLSVGLSEGAVPLSGALAWILKDGIGQFGSVLLASCVHTRFETEAKIWRMRSALFCDAATALEMCTLMCPKLFLPLAALANLGKNVSCLTASASKAALHRSLCREENLGDITAKATSQAIVSSLIGTTLGVSLGAAVGDSSLLMFACLLSPVHLLCTAASLRSTPLRTLNQRRLRLLTEHFLQSGQVMSPTQVARYDRSLLLDTADVSFDTCPVDSNTCSVDTCSHSTVQLHVSDPSVATAFDSLIDFERARQRAANHGVRFLVHRSASRHRVHLWYLHDADRDDFLRGFVAATALAMGLSEEEAMQRSRESSELRRQLALQCWLHEHLLVEQDYVSHAPNEEQEHVHGHLRLRFPAHTPAALLQ